MTGNELVAFARGKIGTPYVYGMKGKVLTQKTYDRLRILFGPLVWESDAAKIGQVCVDCSGLISWGTGILRNSQGYHDTADAVFPIATIGQAPIGAAVWRKGHIGIYIGGGKYIAADGSAYGVRIGAVAGSGFTHWFRLMTCSRRLNTSSCAFSISSNSTTEYGLRRTFSVSWPPSSWPI